jgi:hypothetical protein
MGCPIGVERPLAFEHRSAQPGVGGPHQVPQGLRKRPLAIHRSINRAWRHRARPLNRGRPGVLQHLPRGSQPLGCVCSALLAAGKSAVELALDEADHVDAVDQQPFAAGQPRGVDVEVLHVNATHHRSRQVGVDEPGITQVRVVELSPLQVVRSTEGHHGTSVRWWSRAA